MSYLVKRSAGTIPKCVKSVDEFLDKKHSTYEVCVNPDDNENIAKALDDTDNYPSAEVITEDFMSGFSGRMIHPGCKMVCRGLMDCDPPEPPEYDLPTEEDFKASIREIWFKEFLKNNGLSFLGDIYSMKISDNDRWQIIDACDEDYYSCHGSWPDDMEIFEQYGVV